MSRQKNPIPCERLSVYLPIDLLARLHLLCQDPINGGSSRVGNNKSKYVERLIREDLAKIQPPDQLASSKEIP